MICKKSEKIFTTLDTLLRTACLVVSLCNISFSYFLDSSFHPYFNLFPSFYGYTYISWKSLMIKQFILMKKCLIIDCLWNLLAASEVRDCDLNWYQCIAVHFQFNEQMVWLKWLIWYIKKIRPYRFRKTKILLRKEVEKG